MPQSCQDSKLPVAEVLPPRAPSSYSAIQQPPSCSTTLISSQLSTAPQQPTQLFLSELSAAPQHPPPPPPPPTLLATPTPFVRAEQSYLENLTYAKTAITLSKGWTELQYQERIYDMGGGGGGGEFCLCWVYLSPLRNAPRLAVISRVSIGEGILLVLGNLSPLRNAPSKESCFSPYKWQLPVLVSRGGGTLLVLALVT